jgi:queuine tRNA-ribosyltransferase
VKPKFFNSKNGKIALPVFFPDATRAVLRTLDTTDIENTKTLGILVNTYHLFKEVGIDRIKKYGGVRNLMDWKGGLISDSGGFQIGSLVKKNPKLGKVTDEGVTVKMPGEKKLLLTPEDSIRLQMELGVDMVVVLDDFDAPNATEKLAEESVERTILWARRCKVEFEKICKKKKLVKSKRPYLLGVIQGGRSRELRKYCIDKLLEIGFDGLGYGGEEKVKGNINYDLAKYIRSLVPEHYFLYALGVGTPADIVNMVKIGYNVFDCVLPTRDARHGRMYVYNSKTIDEIDLNTADFYRFYNPKKTSYLDDMTPVSSACDCLTCTRYSKAYLAHLFKIGDFTGARLATIHNLRFYSILMEKLRGVDKPPII